MGTLFAYSLSAGIILAILFLTYRWTMANERQFRLNRVTVYLIYAVSFLSIPGYESLADALSPAPTIIPGTEVNEVSSEVITGMEIEDISSGIVTSHSTPIWISVAVWIYTAGVIFCTARFLYSVIKVISVIRGGKKVGTYGKYKLVASANENIAPFSFGGYMVVAEEDLDKDRTLIITHELTHLTKWHWADLILANIVAIVLWYNPAAWLMIEELKTLHEYQADDSVIRSGADMKDYQYMLIRKAVGERLPSPANSLNHSKLKKRVTMMYKSKPRTLRRVAMLATIPALVAGIAVTGIPAVAAVIADSQSAPLLFSGNSDATSDAGKDNIFIADAEISTPDSEAESIIDVAVDIASAGSVDSPADHAAPVSTVSEAPAASEAESMAQESTAAKQTSNEDEIYVSVEQMAEFPGGTTGMMNYIAKNVVYPEQAYKDGIQGRVIVKFVITKTGKVENPQVVRGIDKQLDDEAIKVVASMPDWTPAKVNGKDVASWFNLPITFKITSDDKQTSDSAAE